MPPEQCPECGRFLKNALVARLRAAPTPCPGCGLQLTALLFSLAGHVVGEADGGDLPSEADAGGRDGSSAREVADAPSVRPPDLAPETVRDTPDVLAGWDRGADAAEEARWQRDRRPFPTDTVVVLGSGVLGSAIGAVAWTGRRVIGGSLGALTGLLAAAAARRIWRLEA